jgi:CHAT domain-containing protein
MALARNSGRPIEARLTGFDWPVARLQRSTHASLLDPARLELAGAASTVIQSQLNDSSARARHESGAAYLLIDRDRDAIDALDSAVRQSPNNAAYWSDLAAARYTLAVVEKRPHELPQALADADHALRLDPKLPDALFNRALIIEALGISEAARRAWQRYAVTDPSSHWGTEAMHHLGDLHVVTTRDEFQHRLAIATRALQKGDDGPITALARNFPQEARTWSEGPLLSKWADAVHKGDSRTAAETLTVVRTLGAALGEFNHVQSVADIVAAIDRADATHLQILADAHAVYRDARVLYDQRRIVDAQDRLRRASELFARGGSPMSIIADYYLANCLYDSSRPMEASTALAAVAQRVDSNRYPGLAAEIQWEQTLCDASTGNWDDAIRRASEARRVFSRLGEIQNRAEMDVLLAGYFDHASQPVAAWKARVAGFAVLSRAGISDRIRNSLLTGINAETSQSNFEAALALAHVALDELRHSPQPIGVSIAEASRAEILARIGEFPAAFDAIRRARLASKTIHDAELQRRTSAAIDVAEGVVDRDSNPRASLQLLNAAVVFYQSASRNTWLPKAYLERGRTQSRLHDDSAALADFDAGIDQVEVQRSSISDRDVRGTFYDTAPELFSEEIALLLQRGDVARSFERSEQSRARSVYEDLGSHHKASAQRLTVEDVRSALPSDTALIEYAQLQDSVAIFYFTTLHSGVVRVAISPAALRTLIDHCRELLQRRGDPRSVQTVAGQLHRLLISPVARELAGAQSLIIVPDRQLHGIPFAALYDAARGRNVVDDVSVSIAPNAASILQRRRPQILSPVLIVGDPHEADAPPLPEAAAEAEAIAAMYTSATLLTGEHATRARFIDAAVRSGLIHYAGHAESDAADTPSEIHLASNGAHVSGDLDATAIAALHLTNAPVVVLAACGTIRGESAHVEGMPSIARAFLAAGARGVVGTLWDVDDDTVAPLFRRLHHELRGGADIRTALRNAQIALKHDPDPRLRHPSTWAPIELLGYSNEQRPLGN